MSNLRTARPRLRVLAILILSSLASACLTPDPGTRRSPDAELERLLLQLRDARGGRFELDVSEWTDIRGARNNAAAREGAVMHQVRRLAFEFPNHMPTQVAVAALAYEQHDLITAQKHLDHVLRIDPSHTQGALLRIRIAAEEGNLPFARRKLLEQLMLAPDDADLHEAYSGVLYLLGDLEEAVAELDEVARLREEGDHGWRTDYHRGLVAEASGDLNGAMRYYDSCIQHRPEFDPAHRRLRWLSGQNR